MAAHEPQPVAATTRPDHGDDELLAEISRRYYLDNCSKVEIAQGLGLSRFKVARLLEQARERGVVKISVSIPAAVDKSLSGELAERLDLRRCIVVDTTRSEVETRQQVAAAAARTLPGLVHNGDLLGLTWSRTVDAMVDNLADLPRCTVVQLAGSAAPIGGAAVDLVQRAARLAGGVAHAVHAPLVVDDAGVAAALRRQPGIGDTLQLADGLDVSVVAVGAWRADCSTVWEAVTPAIRRAGLRAGAVDEVTGWLLAADGKAVASPLDDLVIGASLEQLARPAERVALVSGPYRAEATVAAVRAGLATTLVITSNVARSVIRLLDAR